ncbi:MAG: ABC transporter permease [Anaerolineales bacterium]
MNKIIAIAWKDILVRFASRSEWLFFLILPLVFTFILGGGFTGGEDVDRRLRLLVTDEASNPLAADLLAALEKSETVSVDTLTRAEAENEFGDNNASAWLIIPNNFADGLKLELKTQPNDLNAQAAERAILAAAGAVGLANTTALQSAAEAERIRPFADEAERQRYLDEARAQAQALLADAPDQLEVTRAATPDRVQYDPAANTSAGQLITWVFIPLIGISGLFAFERQQGTLRRLFTTPTERATYLLGTLGGQVIIALAQMTLLVLFGIFVMRLNWGSAPAALALMLVTSALAAAALGTTLGTFVKSEGQATGLSIMLGMVMALFGGCWYPIELFPDAVRTAVNVIPTKWAMQGLLDIVLRGQDVGGVLLEASVLAGFATLFFAVGVWRFRYE